MRVELTCAPNDPELADGGALAPRRWEIGHIHVIVISGWERGDNDQYRVNTFGPQLRVIPQGNLYGMPDWNKPVDMDALTAALDEARIELQRMKDYISAKTEELTLEVQTKANLAAEADAEKGNS